MSTIFKFKVQALAMTGVLAVSMLMSAAVTAPARAAEPI